MVILTSPVIRWNFDIGPAGRFKQLLYLCLKISWAAVLDGTAKAFLSFGFPFLFNGSSGFARFCNFFALISFRFDPGLFPFPDRTIGVVIVRIHSSSGTVHRPLDQTLLTFDTTDRIATFCEIFQSNDMIGSICDGLCSDITANNPIST